MLRSAPPLSTLGRARSGARLRRLARGLGTAGNVCFLVGSALFLSAASERVGVWLFVIGSAALLTGSLLEDWRRARRR